MMIIIGTTSYCQSTKTILSELENKWETDENGDVTFTRIVELPNLSKEQIFNRAIAYYRKHYGNAQSVQQTKDENKFIIIRKAMYENIHAGYNNKVNHLNAWHVLTFHARDNFAEIHLTLTEYVQIVEKYLRSKDEDVDKIAKSKVRDNYPVNLGGAQKTVMAKTFYKTYKAAMVSLDAIANGIAQ